MKQDIDNIINILQGYKVKKVALFGSYARGDIVSEKQNDRF